MGGGGETKHREKGDHERREERWGTEQKQTERETA